MVSWLRKIFVFNQAERDLWVEKQAAAIPAGSRVLDVGAGSCRYRALFRHCEYQSQDFAELPDGQLGRGATYGRMDYISDILAIPVADASFDVVLCTEVLEHVPEPILAVRELARLLRPGGRLLLTAPLGSGLHQEPYHYYGGFTPHWYRRFLGEAGFSDIVVEPNAGFFKHFAQESIRLLQLTRPFRLGMPLVMELLWLPCWVLLGVVLGTVITVVCPYLERFDRDKSLTVGYLVTAIRN